MAQQIAHVIARDLPGGAELARAPTARNPNTQYDASWCGNCHKPEYDAWQQSAHAHAAQDTMVQVRDGRRAAAARHAVLAAVRGLPRSREPAVGRQLARLGPRHHLPRLPRRDAPHPRRRQLGHRGDVARLDAVAPAAGVGSRSTYLKTPDFCARCHQQFVPGTGIVAIDTLGEWQASPFSAATGRPTTCVDCHMPDNGSGHARPLGARAATCTSRRPFDEPDFATTVGKKLSIGDPALGVGRGRRGARRSS